MLIFIFFILLFSGPIRSMALWRGMATGLRSIRSNSRTAGLQDRYIDCHALSYSLSLSLSSSFSLCILIHPRFKQLKFLFLISSLYLYFQVNVLHRTLYQPILKAWPGTPSVRSICTAPLRMERFVALISAFLVCLSAPSKRTGRLHLVYPSVAVSLD